MKLCGRRLRNPPDRMKNLRLKVLLVLIILSTSLTIWTWLVNLNNIDLAYIKNKALENELRIKIEKNTDTSFLKHISFDLLNKLSQQRKTVSEKANGIQNLIEFSILISFLSICLTLLELRRKAHSNHLP